MGKNQLDREDELDQQPVPATKEKKVKQVAPLVQAIIQDREQRDVRDKEKRKNRQEKKRDREYQPKQPQKEVWRK